MIDYSRYPRPESVEYFEKAMNFHDKVRGINKIEDYYYKIDRINMRSIRVLITNFYTLGLGELLDIFQEYKYLDCVITISNWNKCTEQAYCQGKSRGVGVFTMSEFMGAINFEKPYNYIRPVDRKDDKRSVGI